MVDDNGMSFRESLFIALMFLGVAGFLACSLALHAIAANLPWIILAGAGGFCLAVVTVTKCYLRVIEARERYYLSSQHYDYIEAGCREVGPVRKLLGRER